MKKFKCLKFTLILTTTLMILIPESIFGWESQLFPFNAGTGKYEEQTVNFDGRDWKLLDFSYVGYNLGETPLRYNVPCNIQTISGSGDITQELQNAINSVGSSGGGIVRIPAGTYTITSAIGINYPNVSIEGAGSNNTFINIPSSVVFNEDANAFEGVFTFEKNAWAWNKGWVESGTELSQVTNIINKESTYITGLTNLSNVNVGDWIVVQQYFWTSFIQDNSEGTWQ